MPRAQLIPPTVIALATLLSFGPHLLILGCQVAGTAPPAELLLLCPLHHAESAHRAAAWSVAAKPLA